MSVLVKTRPFKVTRREDGETRGLFLGRSGETGVWRCSTSRWRLMWNAHDSLFIAFGRLRLRIMRPSAFKNLGR